VKAYVARVWLALDILLNAIFGGDVETISSRMGRAIKEGRRCRLCTGVCWLLSRVRPDHCVNNIMKPIGKK
jgi:hypothetical protein